MNVIYRKLYRLQIVNGMPYKLYKINNNSQFTCESINSVGMDKYNVKLIATKII